MKEQPSGSEMAYGQKVNAYVDQFRGQDRKKVEETLRIVTERLALPDMLGDSEEAMRNRRTHEAQKDAAEIVLKGHQHQDATETILEEQHRKVA